jgi:pimeloyl-ACP methyl ester carboxylesterase
MDRQIARFTLDGVHDATKTVHPFTTEDGLGLTLTRFHRADCDDVVLLVHGLTSSSDMYIMPEHHNVADSLLDAGFTDVWALDYRMSNRFPYNTETHRDTLDHVARFDHPAALRELRRHIGGRRLHVIAHCIGSVTFSMSLFGGTVDGITSLVCNSVSLLLRISRMARAKLAVGPGLIEYGIGLPFVDPRFGESPAFTRPWMISRLVSLFHSECDVRSCHMVSFMWGSGRPSIFEHDNLLPVTHERTADLESAVGIHYYRHIRKMVRAGHAVRFDEDDPRLRDLPRDYLAGAADVATPILFLTGDRNRVFTDSNIACHDMLSRLAPGRHELEVLEGYGHQDPFAGRNAHVDVYPRIVDFFRKHAKVQAGSGGDTA